MGLIICATRGGEASYNTQKAAIELAKERGDEIAFLYIIDLRFLNKTAAPIVVDIEHELEQMGRFFLLMAKERAEEHGIQAQTLIRKGNVRDEIKNASIETGASIAVLGRPAGELSSFQIESLEALANEVEEEIGVKVVLV